MLNLTAMDTSEISAYIVQACECIPGRFYKPASLGSTRTQKAETLWEERWGPIMTTLSPSGEEMEFPGQCGSCEDRNPSSVSFC